MPAAVQHCFRVNGLWSPVYCCPYTHMKQCAITTATLGKYAHHPDPKRRTKLQSGKPSLMGISAQGFVVDVLRRHDRATDGMNSREAINSKGDLSHVSDICTQMVTRNLEWWCTTPGESEQSHESNVMNTSKNRSTFNDRSS